MQQDYIYLLTSKTKADKRIKAAWLEGSFGRGNADRYSDLDIHMLLSDADLPDFKANVEAWLAAIAPLVQFRLLFDSKMINALTRDGLRLDLWLHAGDIATLDEHKARVLAADEHGVRFEDAVPANDPAATAQALQRAIGEFWRCVALLPVGVGRNELITCFMGLTVQTNLLADMLLNGYGIARDRGVKNLNQFLPAEARQAIEDALSLNGLSTTSLARAHLALARVMQQHGPVVAARHSIAYPADLEAAVLRYVQEELALLGLDSTMDDGR